MDLPFSSARALEPGTVEVLVIPNLRDQVPRNLLAPGASSDLLEAMAEHLRRRCPPEVSVRVRNPVYVHVQASLWVCLREGVDPIGAQRELGQALTRALSPWCFDAAAEVNAQIARYNVLLTRLDEATGRLLDNVEVQLADDTAPALPLAGQAREMIGDLKLDQLSTQIGSENPSPAISPPPLPYGLPNVSPLPSAPTVPALPPAGVIAAPVHQRAPGRRDLVGR